MFKKFLSATIVFAAFVAVLGLPGRGLAAVDVDVLRAQISALLAQVQQLQQQINAMQGVAGSGSDVLAPGSNPYVLPGSGQSAGATKAALSLTRGDRIQAKEAVRTRSSANGLAVATVQAGAKGTVAGTSVWKDGYWWAEIYWDNRTRGFSAEDYLVEIPMPITGICGDVNGDGVVNIQDTVWVRVYALENGVIPTGANADLNADGVVDIRDYSLIDAYVLRGGQAPSCVAPQRIPVIIPETSPQPTFNSVLESQVFTPDYSMCGDVNGDRGLNIFDQDLISEVAFQGRQLPVGARGDLNGDGVINILDVTLISNHLNRGGSAPTCMTTVTNNAPKITGLPALPSRIEKGQLINLSWTATDAENDPLQWNVSWGDGAVNACASACGNQYAVGHTWSSVGTFSVEAKVYDGKVWSTPHRFTVEVVLPIQDLTNINTSKICGDVDQNGVVGDSDLTALNDYIFGGAQITNMLLVDMNGDGIPNIVDVSLLTNLLRGRTPVPTCPGLNNTYSPYSGSPST